jgi:hypothetical protein
MSWQPDTKSRRLSEFLPHALLAELHAPLVAAVLALQAALALLLAMRVVAGPAAQGAATTAVAGGLIVWAVVAATLAAVARWLWFAGPAQANALFDVSSRYLPLAAVSITAASIPLAGAGLRINAAAWLLLAIEELVVMAALPGGRIADHWLMFRSAWPNAARRSESRSRSAAGPNSEVSTNPEIANRPLGSPDAQSPDPACVQWLHRVQTVDGSDLLEGSLSTRFAAGQTTGLIHVAFCPSFARVPTLDYRQQAGPPARIKLGQLLPHGARFDIKLAEPAQAVLHVTLEIIARQTLASAQTPVSASGSSAERSTSSLQ